MEKELQELFEEWKNKLGTCFTYDGIMYQNGKTNEQVEKEWMASPKRVVFLLKDQHQFGDGEKWDEQIRYWLKDLPNDDADTLENKIRNRNLVPPKFKNGKIARKTIFKPIAYILWGLVNVDRNNDWWYQEVENHHEDVKKLFNTQPFALVECKKDPGGPICNPSILKYHLEEYGNFLKEEIKILNPNMIVCTNELIYDFVQKKYFENEELIKIEGKHNSVRYHQKSDTLIFCSFHPSARYKKSYEIYDGVMSHYRAFLKSEYSFCE